MKIEIENLKQLIYGRELTAYQKALAMNEWSKLQQYVNDLEKLNIPAVIKSVCDCDNPKPMARNLDETITCITCRKVIEQTGFITHLYV